jgi:NitT/TauT family transport system substrate-binding protein
MNKKQHLYFLFFAIINLSITNQIHAADLQDFKLGISAPVFTVLPAWFGEASGSNNKNGLKVQTVSMEGGSRGTQVLLSGEIQSMHVGLSPVVQANAQGADLRAVAASANVLPMTVFTIKKNDPVLPKGTRFGISTFGSETDVAATILLAKLGLSRQDIEITQVGGTGQRFAALISGRIDAALLMEPATTQAKAKGLNPVFDLSEASSPWIFDAVVMTASYIKTNRPTALAFVRGYIEGAYWGLKNEQQAKAVIAQKFKTQDSLVIDATYNDFKRMMPHDGKPSIDGAKNVIEQLSKMGTNVRSYKTEDYLDLSLIDELSKNGFFDEMNSQYKNQ